jgi:hypothetical protein
VLDLKATPNRLAQGVVIEAAMRQGLGPVATTLIQRGTLRTGDIFVSGASYGKVRLLMDHTGKRVKEALPSMPVQIVGFDTVPGAGDNFMVVDKEETARAVAEARKKILREAQVNCLLCNCLLQLLTLLVRDWCLYCRLSQLAQLCYVQIHRLHTSHAWSRFVVYAMYSSYSYLFCSPQLPQLLTATITSTST